MRTQIAIEAQVDIEEDFLSTRLVLPALGNETIEEWIWEAFGLPAEPPYPKSLGNLAIVIERVEYDSEEDA